MGAVAAHVPTVSILLPTYNRARFLPAALDAIRAQTYTDWELVVVDDGSTDDTAEVLARLCHGLPQPVRCVTQPNAGAYGARNTALDHARGRYMAFYDSDDKWLPMHLESCVRALDANPDVAWVYAACRIVDHATGAMVDSDTFRIAGTPRPFMALTAGVRGALRVFEDARTVACALTDGLYCGLQNSVIRREVFEPARFQAAYRNEAEDQLFVIRALKNGWRMGYLDAVHVEYVIHSANSSASATGQTTDRQLAVYRPLVRGFEELVSECAWTPLERRALAQRLAREHFWHVGYAVLWRAGRRREALEAYRAGLRVWPWSLSAWKTYLLARLRTGASGAAGEAA